MTSPTLGAPGGPMSTFAVGSVQVTLKWLLQLAPTCSSSPGLALSPTYGRTGPPKE
jgi:hypothetical protein